MTEDTLIANVSLRAAIEAIRTQAYAEGRAAGLEEAAKICERWHPHLYAPEMGGEHPRDATIRDAKVGIAAAIRAAIEKNGGDS